MKATNSPRLDLERDSADRVHINLAGVVGLVHIFQPNDEGFSLRLALA